MCCRRSVHAWRRRSGPVGAFARPHANIPACPGVLCMTGRGGYSLETSASTARRTRFSGRGGTYQNRPTHRFYSIHPPPVKRRPRRVRPPEASKHPAMGISRLSWVYSPLQHRCFYRQRLFAYAGNEENGPRPLGRGPCLHTTAQPTTAAEPLQVGSAHRL